MYDMLEKELHHINSQSCMVYGSTLGYFLWLSPNRGFTQLHSVVVWIEAQAQIQWLVFH